MRARTGFVLLAVAVFLAVLAWRLPLRWVVPLLPAGATCSAPAGSLWRGYCSELAFGRDGNALSVGAVSWKLRPAALLTGRIAGEVRAAGPLLQGHGEFSLGSGRLELRNVDGTAPLDRRLLPMLPANWTGRLSVRLVELRVASGRLERAQGEAELRDIEAQGPRAGQYGSYALTLPAAPAGQAHRGELRDLGGPVELTGTVVLQPDLSWQLDALARARPSAGAALSRAMEFLGPADAQGRRRISAAGDFH